MTNTPERCPGGCRMCRGCGGGEDCRCPLTMHTVGLTPPTDQRTPDEDEMRESLLRAADNSYAQMKRAGFHVVRDDQRTPTTLEERAQRYLAIAPYAELAMPQLSHANFARAEILSELTRLEERISDILTPHPGSASMKARVLALIREMKG